MLQLQYARPGWEKSMSGEGSASLAVMNARPKMRLALCHCHARITAPVLASIEQWYDCGRSSKPRCISSMHSATRMGGCLACSECVHQRERAMRSQVTLTIAKNEIEMREFQVKVSDSSQARLLPDELRGSYPACDTGVAVQHDAEHSEHAPATDAGGLLSEAAGTACQQC